MPQVAAGPLGLQPTCICYSPCDTELAWRAHSRSDVVPYNPSNQRGASGRFGVWRVQCTAPVKTCRYVGETAACPPLHSMCKALLLLSLTTLPAPAPVPPQAIATGSLTLLKQNHAVASGSAATVPTSSPPGQHCRHGTVNDRLPSRCTRCGSTRLRMGSLVSHRPCTGGRMGTRRQPAPLWHGAPHK